MMGEEIEARERIHSKKPKLTVPQTRRTTDQPHGIATTLVSGANPMPTCCFCQQQHSSSSCTVIAEKEILKKSGQCFHCLRKGHLSHECRSSVKCSNCHGQHHRSICTRTTPQQPKAPRPVAPTLSAGNSFNQSTEPTSSASSPDQPQSFFTTTTPRVPTSTQMCVLTNQCSYRQLKLTSTTQMIQELS